MTIYLAADHAGFALKEKIKKFLVDSGYKVKDFGAYKLDPKDDYPDFVHKAARAVSKDPKNSRAVIFGGSGQGEAEEANRHKNVRAAVVYDYNEKIIKLSREHNDANILSLGARFLTASQALQAVDLWLATPFSNAPRHKRRVGKIDS